jgi:APA family basic amino acid/polyamine antiporter
MSGSNPGPLFMALVAVVFSFFVAWIAAKGAGASTAVNLAINVIQISALVVFSVLAIGYRASHPAGAPAFQYDSQTLATYNYQFATAKDGSTVRDAAAIRCRCSTRPASRFPSPSTIPKRTRAATSSRTPRQPRWLPRTSSVTCSFRPRSPFSSWSVSNRLPRWEARPRIPTKHIPIAVIASLLIQGLVCYLIEYFAANYFLNSGYTMQSASTRRLPSAT